MDVLNPFPDVIIPGISPGVNYCILRVNRAFDGVLQAPEIATRSYICGIGLANDTSRFPLQITWQITTASDCDESNSILPISFLDARGTTIIRSDGFAHFSGKFKIITKEPEKPAVTYLEGRLDLISRSGSLQKLVKECDQDNHIEGWLIG